MFLAVAALLGSAPLEPSTDPDPASLVVPADLDAHARTLVKALADPDHPAREKAHRHLHDLGRFALPALRDGLAAADPEVWSRCELLLPRAVALDTRTRVECFAADADGRFAHALPGAEEFFAVAGRTPAARQLFRDLVLSANRELVTEVGGGDDDVADLAFARRLQLVGTSRTSRPAAALDVVAVLFAECTVPDQGGGVGVFSPTYLISQSQLRLALDSDPRREAMTAILVAWLDTRTDARTLASGMNLAGTFKLPVAVSLAKKVLAGGKATPTQRAQAACRVAQAGTADDLPLLAPLLSDEAVSYTGVMIVNGQRRNNPVQVQDTALAMSLLLTNQDPAEYGMKSRYGPTTSDSLRFNYINYHFDDTDGAADEVRADALARWHEWAGKNVKGYPKAAPPKADK